LLNDDNEDSDDDDVVCWPDRLVDEDLLKDDDDAVKDADEVLLTTGITLSVRSSTVVDSDEVFELELELDELFMLELVDDVEFEYTTERGLYPAGDQHSKSLE
jgi:hypothetical protein